jgi:NTP pyrophosphatase (non-canonical NTP hydrolase)
MNTQILKKAIETYGEEPQIRQCMEECAELISAIADYAESEEMDTDNIIEEMADVLIMCKQVELIVKDYAMEPIATQFLYANKGVTCNKTIKELAEFIKTLNKHLRGKKIPSYEICWQISKITIQFAYLTEVLKLDGVSNIEKEINKKIKFKLNRLKERLEDENLSK